MLFSILRRAIDSLMPKFLRFTQILALIFMLGVLPRVSQAQGSPLLGKFSVSQLNGQVALFWQMVQGSTCNGIQIYRSTDSISFERVGYIPGICGSVFESVNFYFTDSMPVANAVNYYYLELGSIGVSDVLSINVLSSENGGYQIRPHPVIDHAIIYFDKADGLSHIIRIYNMQGQEVFSEESDDDYFNITTDVLPVGSYAFTISSSNLRNSITGVLLIQQ